MLAWHQFNGSRVSFYHSTNIKSISSQEDNGAMIGKITCITRNKSIPLHFDTTAGTDWIGAFYYDMITNESPLLSSIYDLILQS